MSPNNSFPQRAIEACIDAMQSGRIAPRYVKDVLKYKNVDVSPIEPFLIDDNPIIRKAAVQIIVQRGDKNKVIDLLKTEEDKQVLICAIKELTGKNDVRGLEEVASLLNNENQAIREQAIEMFRKSGRVDCLVGLLFDNNDEMVNRIKKYFDESENQSKEGEEKHEP